MDIRERLHSTNLAIGLAIAGTAIFGAFASTPRSPFQPVLPPSFDASGPLESLSHLLGFSRLSTSAMAWVAPMIILLCVLTFVGLMWHAWMGRISMRSAIVLALLFNMIALASPLLFSRDVYSYAAYGRIEAVYGGNPYVETPTDHAVALKEDGLWGLLGPKWVDTPSVYGPLFTSMSAGIARLTDDPMVQVNAYRWLDLLATLLTVWLVASMAKRHLPERAAFAVVVVGCNPVVLFHSLAGGHNDSLLVLAMAASMALALRGRMWWAVVLMSLGACIKVTGGLPLLLLVTYLIAREPREKRLRATALYAGTAALVGLVLAAPYLQTQNPTLGMLTLAGQEGWLAPSVLVRRLVELIGGLFGLEHQASIYLGIPIRIAFSIALVVTMGALVRLTWRRAKQMPITENLVTWGWALMLFLLLAPVIRPWYAVWALPLVWLLPQAPRWAAVGTGAALFWTQWTTESNNAPDYMFRLNIVTGIGRWLISPFMAVLIVWLIRELRRWLREEDILMSPARPHPHHVPESAAQAK